MNNKHFAKLLIDWYETNKRALPWRESSDPYRIWLSEVILQQTRVAQGLPYYEAFVSKYPKVEDLAAAPADEVMRTWQGLGYYSRARNLHACAQQVVELYGGKFPETYEQLLQLKGIGSYTAAAIASFAFKEVVPVVDGNVYRVLARIFGIEADIADAKTKQIFESKAVELISQEHPDAFNQAIMEFGALHCTPHNPLCITCPFQQACVAYRGGLQRALPVKSKKVKVRTRHFYYLLMKDEKERLLVKQRQAGDIWQGLYDFPLIESESPLDTEQLKAALKTTFGLDRVTTVEDVAGKTFKHILTHQRIYASFVSISLTQSDISKINQNPQIAHNEWVNEAKLEELPKPILIEKFLKIMI